MADVVNEVIGIHSVDQWKQYVNKDSNSNAGKLIVVDFTASWCPPCRFIAPIFADLAKKTPGVFFLKVDVDELKTIAEEHKVEAMPTFLFIKNGEEVDRVVGAAKEELAAKITQHSAEQSA